LTEQGKANSTLYFSSTIEELRIKLNVDYIYPLVWNFHPRN